MKIMLNIYVVRTLGSVQGSPEATATSENGHLINTEVSATHNQWDNIKSNCIFAYFVSQFLCSIKTNIFMTLSIYMAIIILLNALSGTPKLKYCIQYYMYMYLGRLPELPSKRVAFLPYPATPPPPPPSCVL